MSKAAWDENPQEAAIALQHPAFHRQQLAPVISKAQFIFSLGFGASPNQSRGQNQPGAAKNEKWVIWLVTDPVITLWNPYDVSLSFENGQIDLHRIPLAFQIFRNGVSPTSKPTLFSNSYLPGDFKGRAKRYYQQQYMLKGVDLRPGWNAPAGQASNKHVGGVSSLNLCVDSAGKNSGRLNGASTRVIPVKGGDRIQIEGDAFHQYEFSWEAMTDWASTPTVEIDPADRGFGGSGIYAQSGREAAPFARVPIAPLTSLALARQRLSTVRGRDSRLFLLGLT